MKHCQIFGPFCSLSMQSGSGPTLACYWEQMKSDILMRTSLCYPLYVNRIKWTALCKGTKKEDNIKVDSDTYTISI